MPVEARIIDEENFLTLQRYAVPLVDDTNRVLKRILIEYELLKSSSSVAVSDAPRKTAMSRAKWPSLQFSRGGQLPVGLKMEGKYKGKTVTATVGEKHIVLDDGHEYPDPTSAAKAAKRRIAPGAEVPPTNGWNFWHYHATTTSSRSRKPIDSFRNFPDEAMDEFGQIQLRENLGSPEDGE